MLIVEVPRSFLSERVYIINLICKTILGLELQILPTDGKGYRLSLQGDSRKKLEVEDLFFQMPEESWLKPSSLPQTPLPRAKISTTRANRSDIPLVFAKEATLSHPRDFGEEIPWDLFGSSFFLVSRYEEVVATGRDFHQRFPAQASLAYQEGFLHRALVNEYAEILWRSLQKLWPSLQRKKSDFKILLSHDVDVPFFFSSAPYPKLFLRSARQALQTRSSLPLRSFFQEKDPYDTFDWIMDQSEKLGLLSSFNFIPGGSSKFDRAYQISDPRILKLFDRIKTRGFEIGFHPSYQTFRNPELFFEELETLRRLSPQEILGGRQHYLRFEVPWTWRTWNKARLKYDSTLGYAETTGFRASICQEFPVYDVIDRKPLELFERPLILMEGSILDEERMNLGVTERARQHIQDLKSECRHYGGDFTVLWHNSRLVSEAERDLYLFSLSV